MTCRNPDHPIDPHDCHAPARKFDFRWAILATAVFTAVWTVALLVGAARANAAPAGIVVDEHHVVVSSTLPPCTFTEGYQARVPCTYNVGEWGNNTAQAYWIGRDYAVHRVWGRLPRPVRKGWAHWSTPANQSRYGIGSECWVHGDRYRCP